MFRLITAFSTTHCDLSGKVIKKGEQMYFCDESRRVIDAFEYEQLMSNAKIQNHSDYFKRHQKINKIK